jgi:hypothetical protein
MFGPRGNDELRGVIPRAADALFAGIAESSEIEEVTLKCSFLEIYKEAIRDLLAPKNTGLKIRELPTGEVYVQGLSDQYVASSGEIMSLLAAGEKYRSTAATDMNEVSSRSHSLLIVVVSMKLKDGSSRVGKLNLADLAGSERIEVSNDALHTLLWRPSLFFSCCSLFVCSLRVAPCLSARTRRAKRWKKQRRSMRL